VPGKSPGASDDEPSPPPQAPTPRPPLAPRRRRGQRRRDARADRRLGRDHPDRFFGRVEHDVGDEVEHRDDERLDVELHRVGHVIDLVVLDQLEQQQLEHLVGDCGHAVVAVDDVERRQLSRPRDRTGRGTRT
jgi:hypothetical protein